MIGQLEMRDALIFIVNFWLCRNLADHFSELTRSHGMWAWCVKLQLSKRPWKGAICCFLLWYLAQQLSHGSRVDILSWKTVSSIFLFVPFTSVLCTSLFLEDGPLSHKLVKVITYTSRKECLQFPLGSPLLWKYGIKF